MKASPQSTVVQFELYLEYKVPQLTLYRSLSTLVIFAVDSWTSPPGNVVLCFFLSLPLSLFSLHSCLTYSLSPSFSSPSLCPTPPSLSAPSHFSPSLPSSLTFLFPPPSLCTCLLPHSFPFYLFLSLYFFSSLTCSLSPPFFLAQSMFAFASGNIWNCWLQIWWVVYDVLGWYRILSFESSYSKLTTTCMYMYVWCTVMSAVFKYVQCSGFWSLMKLHY